MILKNNACHGIFRHFCGFSFFVCHLPCVLYAWFCVCVLSWEVWTVTSLSTVLVSVCAYKWSEILASRERQHACTLLTCSLVCVWCHGCATVLTVSFHWRCMLAVFVFFVTFWCTQPEQSLYVLWHCLSLLAPSAICFFFFGSPSLRSISTFFHDVIIPPTLCHVCSSVPCVTRTTCSSTNAQCESIRYWWAAAILR